MVNLRSINNKIFAIQKTQQITKAMEMVAIAKIFKIKQRIKKINPLIEKLYNLINIFIKKNYEYDSLYIYKRKIKHVVFFIISSDKGLCGNLNINIFNKVLSKIKYFNKRHIQVDLIVVGNKGYSYFNKLKFNIIDFLVNINHNFLISDLRNIIEFLIDLYLNKKIDRLYLVFNQFKNNMCYVPSFKVILPLSMDVDIYNNLFYQWDYIYECNKKDVLHDLVLKYMKSNIFYFILENMLSEQSSRALVMKNATDNSVDFMKKLNLMYNNVRQGKITQELTEIVSGSSFICFIFCFLLGV